MLQLINLFLIVLTTYAIIGLIVGLIFLSKAVKIDPHMRDTKKGVRLLLLPGVIATWPFFILKLFRSKSN